MDNIKKWTSLSMLEVLLQKRLEEMISAESSFMSP